MALAKERAAKLAAFDGLTAIEQLRKMLLAFSPLRESFLMQFNVTQLRFLYRAWLACDWDYYPDRWHRRQVLEACRGIVPRWDEHGTAPVFDGEANRLRPSR